MSRSRKILLAVTATVGVTACLLLVTVLVVQGLGQATLWAGLVAALAGVVAAGAALWPLILHPPKALPSAELQLEEWIVDRPAELNAVIAALMNERYRTVGITTGLYGAGGFGKTTLAKMVCADRRIRRRFGGRVYLVTVGRDARGPAAIAAKINDVIKLVTGENATFTDPELAGRRLNSLLAVGPRKLLILDDLWEPEQLAPFTESSRRCARLVTTRVPDLLTRPGALVRVDQMSPQQARALLMFGLPPVDPEVVDGLLAVTGRWPLLLRLVNKILTDYAQVASDVSTQGVVILNELRISGPAIVDDVLINSSRELNLNQPQERALAVRTTIEASTSLLDSQDAERFMELGIFAEDEAIPFNLVAQLWGASSGVDGMRAAQICKRLTQLALVSDTSAGPGGGITLHDVVRDFLRAALEGERTNLNRLLLDAIAKTLPAANPLDTADPGTIRKAWWELKDSSRYLWDHLVEHMLDAGWLDDADALAGDLRWVGARLKRFGPAAPTADLAKVATPRACRLQSALARTAHLLAPTEPTDAVIDVLHSRVVGDPDWAIQVAALRNNSPRPQLVNQWPPPDLPDTLLRRVLTSRTPVTRAVAVAPDGSWLASGSWDRTVRIWDTATGQEQAVLMGHTDRVEAVAVAPDGSWLASGSWDRTVRIWDTATGQERAVLKGHTSVVEAVAVPPDGSWLASGGWDQTVRIWDTATGQEQAVLKGHTDLVEAVAVAPDGSWLASGSWDRTVRIWDTATGQPKALMRMDGTITSCAWVGIRMLTVGGAAGLYLFKLLTGASHR